MTVLDIGPLLDVFRHVKADERLQSKTPGHYRNEAAAAARTTSTQLVMTDDSLSSMADDWPGHRILSAGVHFMAKNR